MLRQLWPGLSSLGSSCRALFAESNEPISGARLVLVPVRSAPRLSRAAYRDVESWDYRAVNERSIDLLLNCRPDRVQVIECPHIVLAEPPL
jgi:hypothetical protein